jgi:hypothetical protein
LTRFFIPLFKINANTIGLIVYNFTTINLQLPSVLSACIWVLELALSPKTRTVCPAVKNTVMLVKPLPLEPAGKLIPVAGG